MKKVAMNSSELHAGQAQYGPVALSESELQEIKKGIFSFADKVNAWLLFAMFLFGICIAFFYDTWVVAIGVGGICLGAYYIAKKLLPESDLYQYVLSSISAIFAAQFIYQMHGMAEMHFWVFICSTILIIYQNWKLQIPLIVIVAIHHGAFAYMEYMGYSGIYFTQLGNMDLLTFIFHAMLAACVCAVSAYWSYTIHKRTIQDAMHLKVQRVLKTELQEKKRRAYRFRGRASRFLGRNSRFAGRTHPDQRTPQRTGQRKDIDDHRSKRKVRSTRLHQCA